MIRAYQRTCVLNLRLIVIDLKKSVLRYRYADKHAFLSMVISAFRSYEKSTEKFQLNQIRILDTNILTFVNIGRITIFKHYIFNLSEILCYHFMTLKNKI